MNIRYDVLAHLQIQIHTHTPLHLWHGTYLFAHFLFANNESVVDGCDIAELNMNMLYASSVANMHI